MTRPPLHGDVVEFEPQGEDQEFPTSYLGVEERFTSPTLGVGTRQFESDRPDQFCKHTDAGMVLAVALEPSKLKGWVRVPLLAPI